MRKLYAIKPIEWKHRGWAESTDSPYYEGFVGKKKIGEVAFFDSPGSDFKWGSTFMESTHNMHQTWDEAVKNVEDLFFAELSNFIEENLVELPNVFTR